MAKSIQTRFPPKFAVSALTIIRDNFQYIKDFLRNDVVKYYGPYETGQFSPKGRLVVVSGFMCIANKDTYDYPAPVPVGDPFWLSGWGDTPPLIKSFSAPGNQVTVGLRIVTETRGFINAVRFYATQAGAAIKHELYSTVWRDTPLQRTDQLIVVDGVAQEGWVTLPIGDEVYRPGTPVELWLRTRDTSANASTQVATYVYEHENGNPDSEKAAHQSNPAQIRFHNTPKTGPDMAPFFATMEPGDEISGGGVTWTVDDVDNRGSHTRFVITPATRVEEGDVQFTFTHYADIGHPYGYELDTWDGDPEIVGLYDLVGGVWQVVNNFGYNVDMQVVPANVSEDWDVIQRVV